MHLRWLPQMRLVDRLNQETGPSHPDVDQWALSAPVTTRGYQRYLMRTFGFVAPVERTITSTPKIDKFVDPRRFNKEELLRRDMIALRMTPAQIDAIRQCAVPLFDQPEEALGWAYFVERSTLAHNAVFRHFARGIPGDVAFASTYLKCYFGSVGEMWRGFGEALDGVVARGEAKVKLVIDGAQAAFRFYRGWSEQHEDEHDRPTASSGARPTHA